MQVVHAGSSTLDESCPKAKDYVCVGKIHTGAANSVATTSSIKTTCLWHRESRKLIICIAN